MGRANKRGGFGVLRGATNNKMGITPIAPNNPNHLDRWVDKDTNQEYYWNKPTTEWIPLFGAGSGGNVNGLVYHNDTNTTAVTTSVEVGTVDVTMAFDGSIIVHGTFVGTASAAAILTTLVKLDTVTQHTIVDYVTGATDYTVSFSLVLEGIVAGDYTVSVDMAASAGTFTLDASEQHLFCLNFYDAVIGGSGGGAVVTTAGYILCGVGTSYLTDNDEYVPDTWTSKTDAILGVYEVASSEISNAGYVFNGSSSTGRVQNNDEYVPDTWTSKTDSPAPGRRRHASSTISSAAYIYGGFSTTALLDNDEYIPDSWTSKTNIPSPARYWVSSATLASSGYILGGYNNLTDTDEYTPDSWTSKTNMLSGRYQTSSTESNSKIYTIGGLTSFTRQTDNDEYVVDSWTSKTSMTVSKTLFYISSIGENIYSIAGEQSTSYTRTVYEYSVSGDSWASKTDTPLPARRDGCAIQL